MQQYELVEKIKLDPNKIEYNPGLRLLGKLMANSFWGKFGQRENLGKTVIVNTKEELYKIVCDKANEVTKIFPVSNELLYVHYRLKDEFVVGSPNTNVVIAAVTTSLARLKLYSYLEQLGDRVLYYDTDSIFWVRNELDNDEYKVPLGNFLGDMTDELACYGKGSYIQAFASGGPKFYSYRVVTPGSDQVIEVCKAKGITLNYTTKQQINHDAIKYMIENEDQAIDIESRVIRRADHHNVVTRTENKKCQVTSRKRRFIHNGFSVPYGHKFPRQE